MDYCKKLDYVIWTNLSSKFNGINNKVPILKDAIEYLLSLTGDVKKEAIKYIVNTPDQVMTEYRKEFIKII